MPRTSNNYYAIKKANKLTLTGSKSVNAAAAAASLLITTSSFSCVSGVWVDRAVSWTIDIYLNLNRYSDERNSMKIATMKH